MVTDRLIMLVESRIRGNVYVRFGGEHTETCRSNAIRRRVLSLHEYLLHDTFRRLGCEVKHKRAEIRYSIRRRASVSQGSDHRCNIWSIHGELDKPNTMMLGLDHYIESSSRMEEYVKGKRKDDQSRNDSVEKRLLKGDLNDETSWIDLFFYTDVHIIGHGLDYSETDLWWILNRRMRLFKKLGRQVEPNTITYYGQLDSDKAHLLQKFGVQYYKVPITGKNYVAQYQIIFDILDRVNGI